MARWRCKPPPAPRHPAPPRQARRHDSSSATMDGLPDIGITLDAFSRQPEISMGNARGLVESSGEISTRLRSQGTGRPGFHKASTGA